MFGEFKHASGIGITTFITIRVSDVRAMDSCKSLGEEATRVYIHGIEKPFVLRHSHREMTEWWSKVDEI